MIMMGLFLIELIALLLVYRTCRNLYPGLSDLDEKEFKLKKMLPIGVFIVQDVLKYRFDRPKDAVTQGKLAQLYGAKQAGTYLRLNMANQVCIAILGVLIATFLSGAVMLQEAAQNTPAENQVVMKGNQIQRPALGEGAKSVTVKGTYKAGESEQEVTYQVNIGEQIPGPEECVDIILELLPTAILNENSGLNQVTGNLLLAEKSEKYKAEIQWKSSDEAVIALDGVVQRPEETQKDKKVMLTATVSKAGIIKSKEYPVVVSAKAPLTDAQKVQVAQELAAAQMETVNEDTTEKNVTLPKEFKGAKIGWEKVEEKAANAIPIFVFGLVATFLIIVLNGRTLDESIRKRKESMQVDYPEFLNKLIVLLTSGMNMQKALEKVGNDYISSFERTGAKKPLYEELLLTVSEINGGKVFSEAMNNFALRCKTREILKFVSIVELNAKKGSGELLLTLKTQSIEAWEGRKAVAKRKGEEASTKLLLPMAIMLVAILLIVVTPAALSISGM